MLSAHGRTHLLPISVRIARITITGCALQSGACEGSAVGALILFCICCVMPAGAIGESLVVHPGLPINIPAHTDHPG